MRIEDEDILNVIKRDGPSTAYYIAGQLNIDFKSDRQKMNRKLRILAVYGFVTREAIEGAYVYSLPGDTRPPNRQIKKVETAKGTFTEYVANMKPGDTITRQELQAMTGVNEKWARKMLQASGLIPIRPRDYRKPTKWQKGASQ